MAYESKAELTVSDAPKPELEAVSSLAHGLLLDATDPFDFRNRDPAAPLDRRVDYVLGADEAFTRARYVGISIDNMGLQVAMLPFSEKGMVTLPAVEGGPVEILQSEGAGRLVSVNFFSYLFEPAGVRLEGAESGGEEDDIQDLVTTMQDPGLQEIDEARSTVKYAGITVAMIKMMSESRRTAFREFMIRKEVDLMNIVADNEEKISKRAELEGTIEELEAEIAENEWKIAHPVRGVIKEAVQNLFSRRRTSSNS